MKTPQVPPLPGMTPLGQPTTNDRIVREIHTILDGTEWSADTLEAIAEVLTDNGYKLRNFDLPAAQLAREEFLESWAEKHLKAFHLDDEELGALIDYHESQITIELESGEPENKERRRRVQELWAVLRQK